MASSMKNSHTQDALPPSSSIPEGSHSDTREYHEPFKHYSGSRGRKGKRCYEPGYNLSTAADSLDAAQTPSSSSSSPESTYLYFCTFCFKRFKNEFSWRRHEVGVHGYNDVEWPCPFHNTSLVGKPCLFCTDTVHDMSHYFDRHGVHLCFSPWTAENISQPVKLGKGCRRHVCSVQSVADSIFVPKDLLAQHVQGIHLHAADESLRKQFKVPSGWSKAVDPRNIKPNAVWCGFCQ